MRVPAALTAIPLLSGAAAGVLLENSAPERLILAAAFAALLCLLAGIAFYADQQSEAVVLALMVGAAAAGYAAAAAHSRALLAPTLLEWFDANAAGDSDPVTLVGQLRDDGADVGFGVLLTLDVNEASVGERRGVKLQGGVRLTVTGTATPGRIATWRAGRIIRLPVSLRRPIVFSNPGVIDEARALSRRGVVLVGSVKSGSLVEVLAAGWVHQEWAASARAWTRRVIASHVGVHDRRSVRSRRRF